MTNPTPPTPERHHNSAGAERPNNLLSFGMSEYFRDCSIAAATLCADAHAACPPQSPAAGMVLLEQESEVMTAHTVGISTDTILKTGHRVHFALVKDAASSSDSPPSLLAVTRGNIAVRLATFNRRKTSAYCDYVQIGREMVDETDTYVAMPEDESKSRLSIIKTMQALIKPAPLAYDDLPSDLLPGKVESRHLTPEQRTAQQQTNLARLAVFRSLQEMGIISCPGLNALWDAEDYWNYPLFFIPRRLAGYIADAKKLARHELHNSTNSAYPKQDDLDPKINQLGAYIEQVSTRYRSQSAAAPAELIRLLDLESTFAQLLGITSPAVEDLIASPMGLPRIAQNGSITGTYPNIRIGNTSTEGIVTVHVEKVHAAGYNVSVSAKPATMAQSSPQSFFNKVIRIDQPLNASDIASLEDVADIIKTIQNP